MIGPPLSPSSNTSCASHCHHWRLSLSLPCAVPQVPSLSHSDLLLQTSIPRTLGNHILVFCCPLGKCDTSLFKALELTARSLPTLPSQYACPAVICHAHTPTSCPYP